MLHPCRYRESWACAPILTLCSESHQLEIDALLPPTDPLRRVVRSPKKRGGVSGRIRTAGKIASGIVRQRAGSRSGGSGSGITRLLGGSASKKGTSSLGGSKSKSKSKVFGKVGKYAVAGLAGKLSIVQLSITKLLKATFLFSLWRLQSRQEDE